MGQAPGSRWRARTRHGDSIPGIAHARHVEGTLAGRDHPLVARAGLFSLPYYRTSWSIYRGYLSSVFVEDFEKRYDLDPSIEAGI